MLFTGFRYIGTGGVLSAVLSETIVSKMNFEIATVRDKPPIHPLHRVSRGIHSTVYTLPATVWVCVWLYLHLCWLYECCIAEAERRPNEWLKVVANGMWIFVVIVLVVRQVNYSYLFAQLDGQPVKQCSAYEYERWPWLLTRASRRLKGRSDHRLKGELWKLSFRWMHDEPLMWTVTLSVIGLMIISGVLCAN